MRSADAEMPGSYPFGSVGALARWGPCRNLMPRPVDLWQCPPSESMHTFCLTRGDACLRTPSGTIGQNERDADQLVALLFVAATPLRRTAWANR